VSARWPAATAPPVGSRKHERSESLSVVNWVKRMVPFERGGRESVPSTYSIASAPFRKAVLARWEEPAVVEAVTSMRVAYKKLVDGRAVREKSALELVTETSAADDVADWLIHQGGPWVDGSRWTLKHVRDELGAANTAASEDLVMQGARAARDLARTVGQKPGTHLAVVAHDLDDMGRFLSGVSTAKDGSRCEVNLHSHRQVSKRLAALGRYQRQALDVEGANPHQVVLVYAAGDDVLLLAPASEALAVADVLESCSAGFDDLPTGSTAVGVFSQYTSLQGAVRFTHALLDEYAKKVP